MVLVIARNHRQFVEYCRENRVSPYSQSVRYVSDIEQVRGLRNCELVYYGTAWENPVYGDDRLKVATTMIDTPKKQGIITNITE